MTKAIFAATILALLLLTAPPAATFAALSVMQQAPENPDYDAAQQALHAGDYQKAIADFQQYIERKPKSFNGHYYLGLSYRGAKQFAEAVAALQRAGEIEALPLARYEIAKTYLAAQNYAHALAHFQWLQTQDAELAEYLHNQLPNEMVAAYRLPPSPITKLLAEAKLVEDEQVPAMTAELRPTILYKERAVYTEVARRNKVQGTVTLNLIYTKNGDLFVARVVRGLPDGLTKSAITAAQKIRFQPATKDGQPVTVRGNIEFNFRLY